MITERLKTSSATTTSGPVELEEAGEVKKSKKKRIKWKHKLSKPLHESQVGGAIMISRIIIIIIIFNHSFTTVTE